MSDDPFGVLGLSSDATADDVRSAQRQLAKQHHPDVGGEPAAMQRLNLAVTAALRLVAVRDADADPPSTAGPWTHPQADVPSFTVEALPAITFEALLAVAGSFGRVVEDEPPYHLDVELGPPGDLQGWCHLEVMPDAGASTVSLLSAHDPAVPVERVRDLWVAALNELDWTSLTA